MVAEKRRPSVGHSGTRRGLIVLNFCVALKGWNRSTPFFCVYKVTQNLDTRENHPPLHKVKM